MVETPVVFEPRANEAVSDTVIRALAETEGVDPTSMDVQLYQAVDPDALDALMAPRSTANGRRVSFSIAGHLVAVDESQCVYVTPGGTPAGADRPTSGSDTPPGGTSDGRAVFPRS